MQSLRILGAMAAGALVVAGATFADAAPVRAEARLAAAVSSPVDATVSGVVWHCEGDACVGAAERAANLDNPVRECRKVAAALGPLAAYRTRGLPVTGGDLKVCNAAAATAGGATTTAQK